MATTTIEIPLPQDDPEIGALVAADETTREGTSRLKEQAFDALAESTEAALGLAACAQHRQPVTSDDRQRAAQLEERATILRARLAMDDPWRRAVDRLTFCGRVRSRLMVHLDAAARGIDALEIAAIPSIAAGREQELATVAQAMQQIADQLRPWFNVAGMAEQLPALYQSRIPFPPRGISLTADDVRRRVGRRLADRRPAPRSTAEQGV
jgi:hypothetical protein